VYRSVMVHHNFKSFQNILWRDNPEEELKCLQLQTVTWGLKPSAYLATRCLIELADIYKDKYPLAAAALENNTYIDDILCGAKDIEETLSLQNELISLLTLGHFQLHKWVANSSELLRNIPPEKCYFDNIKFDKNNNDYVKTLGIQYNVQSYCFKVYCPINNIEEITFTKRKVLSFIAKIYDPLGFLGPIITNAKIIMQRICCSKISWDETLPPDLYDMWKTFAEGLISMPSFKIKRDLNFAEAETTDVLGFCDASNVAHGCAIYCRVIKKDGSILTNLVCSKSRISPINEKLTIPRAELNSALLLALLIVKVHKILSRFINNVYIFSDSRVVLSWLKLNPYKLNNYVANRVSKINELTQNFKWNYIESNQNPSDLISRGTTPKTLANSRLWWKGPEFLTQPHLSILMQSEIESLKNIPEVKSYVATTKAEYLPVLTKFSSLQKLHRIIAYVLRFIHNTKNKRENIMRN
ncbi:hypothetical protein ILUMI_15256, partial [Ignelater luminosus]